jgi:hypothetical protein
VRNAVGLKRQFEGAMVDSLKNLWKVLQKVMPEDKPREVKSLMRDAPDYESRTQYRPRHVPAKLEKEEPASFVSKIVEPPISADDTRPRAPVKVEPAVMQDEPMVQTTPITSHAVDDPDTGMIEPVVYPIPVEKPADARDFVPRQEEKRVDSDTVLPRRATQEMKPIVPAPLATTESASINAEEPVEVAPPALPKSEPVSTSSGLDTVKMATGEMSVFELFGLPRPSQTQEINRVVIPEQALEPVEPLPVASVKPNRVGLRLVLRRKRVIIRRPV